MTGSFTAELDETVTITAEPDDGYQTVLATVKKTNGTNQAANGTTLYQGRFGDLKSGYVSFVPAARRRFGGVRRISVNNNGTSFDDDYYGLDEFSAVHYMMELVSPDGSVVSHPRGQLSALTIGGDTAYCLNPYVSYPEKIDMASIPLSEYLQQLADSVNARAEDADTVRGQYAYELDNINEMLYFGYGYDDDSSSSAWRVTTQFASWYYATGERSFPWITSDSQDGSYSADELNQTISDTFATIQSRMAAYESTKNFTVTAKQNGQEIASGSKVTRGQVVELDSSTDFSYLSVSGDTNGWVVCDASGNPSGGFDSLSGTTAYIKATGNGTLNLTFRADKLLTRSDVVGNSTVFYTPGTESDWWNGVYDSAGSHTSDNGGQQLVQPGDLEASEFSISLTSKAGLDPITLVLTKNSTNGTPLPNAVFRIDYTPDAGATDLAGNPATARSYSITTKANGFGDFANATGIDGAEFYRDAYNDISFPAGTLTITETQAPSGYKIDPTPQSIHLPDGSNDILRFKNTFTDTLTPPEIHTRASFDGNKSSKNANSVEYSELPDSVVIDDDITFNNVSTAEDYYIRVWIEDMKNPSHYRDLYNGTYSGFRNTSGSGTDTWKYTVPKSFFGTMGDYQIKTNIKSADKSVDLGTFTEDSEILYIRHITAVTDAVFNTKDSNTKNGVDTDTTAKTIDLDKVDKHGSVVIRDTITYENRGWTVPYKFVTNVINKTTGEQVATKTTQVDQLEAYSGTYDIDISVPVSKLTANTSYVIQEYIYPEKYDGTGFSNKPSFTEADKNNGRQTIGVVAGSSVKSIEAEINPDKGTTTLPAGTTFLNASEDETIRYAIDFTIPGNADYPSDTVVITDTMADDLMYMGEFSMKVDGQEVPASDYKLEQAKVGVRPDGTSNRQAFKVTFTAAGAKKYSGKTGKITYVAKLENARVAIKLPNDKDTIYKNTGHNWKFDNEVSVLTGAFTLTKTDTEAKPMAGVQFELLNADGSVYKTHRKGFDDGAPYILTTDENGQVTFTGLKDGTYKFKELKTNNGWNLLTDTPSVSIKNGKSVSGSISVVSNAKGITLEAGGVGQMILVIAGIAVLALAVVYTIRRKKRA